MSVTINQTGLLEALAGYGHEQVMVCQDPETKLKAIIAVHSSVLGPALGGLRFYDYPNEEAAFFDVLRLSRGMTFKASVAGLNLGGGKAIIIGDPKKIKSEALLRRFGMFVENLQGKYITAEDIGVNERDMVSIRATTKHVVGLPDYMSGSGDPSPVTAYGVYVGMKAALKYMTGNESLENKKVIVEGTGKVGTYLIELLHKEKATIYAYDVDEANLQNAVSKYGAIAISASQVVTQAADVYAPCALGATLNPSSIPGLNVSLVAGGANNQLLDETRDGQAIAARNILYTPDFMLNAGGLINVYSEVMGFQKNYSYAKADEIYQTTLRVFEKAKQESITPHQAALAIALERVNQVGGTKKFI